MSVKIRPHPYFTNWQAMHARKFMLKMGRGPDPVPRAFPFLLFGNISQTQKIALGAAARFCKTLGSPLGNLAKNREKRFVLFLLFLYELFLKTGKN